MTDVMMALVASTCEAEAAGIADLTDRARACMKAARNHWMVLDPDKQLLGALGALWKLSEGEERADVEFAMRTLRMAADLSRGQIPSDMDAVLEESEERIAAGRVNLPLIKLWEESAK